MTHNELVKVAYKWVLKNGCGIAFYELRSTDREIPDVIGFCSSDSVLIECKISRSDFLKDQKKQHREKGMGKYRFYCCPADLIKQSELPEKWGLIYVNNEGKATCIYNPKKDHGIYLGDGNWSKDNSFERNLESEQRLMYSALRRLFLKGFMKHIYDKDYHNNSTPPEELWHPQYYPAS